MVPSTQMLSLAFKAKPPYLAALAKLREGMASRALVYGWSIQESTLQVRVSGCPIGLPFERVVLGGWSAVLVGRIVLIRMLGMGFFILLFRCPRLLLSPTSFAWWERMASCWNSLFSLICTITAVCTAITFAKWVNFFKPLLRCPALTPSVSEASGEALLLPSGLVPQDLPIAASAAGGFFAMGKGAPWCSHLVVLVLWGLPDGLVDSLVVG